MAKKYYTLEKCADCGNPAKEKHVRQPFCHGWVGCKACGNIIPWTGGGKLSAVDQWNAKQREKRGET